MDMEFPGLWAGALGLFGGVLGEGWGGAGGWGFSRDLGLQGLGVSGFRV